MARQSLLERHGHCWKIVTVVGCLTQASVPRDLPIVSLEHLGVGSETTRNAFRPRAFGQTHMVNGDRGLRWDPVGSA